VESLAWCSGNAADSSKQQYEDYYGSARALTTGDRRLSMIYAHLGWAGLSYHWVANIDGRRRSMGKLRDLFGNTWSSIRMAWESGTRKDRPGPETLRLFELNEPPDLDHLSDLDRIRHCLGYMWSIYRDEGLRIFNPNRPYIFSFVIIA